MNDKIINRLGLVALAVFLGGAIGSFTAVFLRLLYKGIEFLWFELPELLSANGEIPFYTLILCIVGGLLVGLCQRYLGDHPQPFQETLASFRETRRFDYNHIGQGMTTATLSLLFGASLGPEAALMDMVGGLGTWTGDQLKRVALRVGVIENEDTAWPRAWKWGLLGTAVAAGIAGFVLFIGDLFSGGLIAVEAYEMNWIDLAYALPVGLAGALGGLLYVQLQNTLPLITDRLKKWPVLRSVSGGVVFGILASIFPLVLFSGQKELQPLYNSHAEQIAWFILLTGLAKFFVTSVLLSTGWKGGHILPVMFAGAAVGLAVSMFFPGIPPVVGYVGGMAGAAVVVMRQPLFVALMLLLFFPWQLLGVILVATLVGHLISKPFVPKPVQISSAEAVVGD